MSWRSSKVSPFATAHTRCAGGGTGTGVKCGLARRPTVEPACRAACTPAISRLVPRVREVVAGGRHPHSGLESREGSNRVVALCRPVGSGLGSAGTLQSSTGYLEYL
eukprot:6820638-Prymnesium_polylepis.1